MILYVAYLVDIIYQVYSIPYHIAKVLWPIMSK